MDRHEEPAAASWAPLRGLLWLTFHCQSGSKDRDRAVPALVGNGQEESRTTALKRNPVLGRKGCRESVSLHGRLSFKQINMTLGQQRPGATGPPSVFL